MPLPDDHLTYPARAYGQDIARYDWALAKDRPPVALPNGRTVAAAIVIPIEFFMLNPSGKPFRHPGGMVTPYPDLRHYTSRDYGNRVGVYRLLDALKSAGLTATFAVNAAILTRAAPLIEAIAADGHEIAAAGLHTDAIHWGGIEPAVEEAYAADTRAAFAAAGLKPRTWMSPVRQQSRRTLDVIAAHGFDVCLDWEVDGVPVRARTDRGAVSLVPLHNELEDRVLLIDRRQTEDEWRDQILASVSLLKEEAPARGAQVLGFAMTPWVTGLPFRIKAVREVFAALSEDGAVWTAGAGAIADAFG
jgi:allantoinase